MRGGRSEVGDGVDGVLLIDSIISLIVGGASSGAMSLTKFAMRFGKIGLELIPSFVGSAVAFPNLAVFYEHAGSVNELKGIVGDLLRSVGREAGGSIVDATFDLVGKGLDR